MLRQRISAFGAFLAVASLLGCAEHPKLPPPSTDIDETLYRDAVRILASDEFEGRKPGTPGEAKTLAYLTEEFRKLGLKPGNGESFLQPVPMLEASPGADTTLSFQGSKPVAFRYRQEMVIWSRSGLPVADLKRSEVVFVGFGIVAPEFGWNDYAGIDVHGKTVVVLMNDPGYVSHDPKMFKGGSMTYYGRWAYKIDEAARQGAAAVLLIHDAEALGYGWNAVLNKWSGAQLQLAAANSDARSAIEGWIQKDAARALFSMAGRDFATLSAAAAQPGFKAIALGVQADATLHESLRSFNSANVIAQWPGTQSRRECVIYTAHWDHLGRDPTLPGHNIFNGAVDNATGVAGLIALAQSFVRTKPVADRSIVFLALTGAESGLLGSEYYVENPVFPLRTTAAVLNLDTLRNRGPTRDMTIFGSGNTDLEDYARAVALLQGREVTPDPTAALGRYYRSDNLSFAEAGVPALYVQGGLDDSARGPAWGRSELEDYTLHRYRQPSDQYSADWDVRGALEDLTLYYDVGNRVARTRRFPRWYPNSEFRVSREHHAAP